LDIVLGVGSLCGFCNERNTMYTVWNAGKVKGQWRNGSGKFCNSSLKDRNIWHLLLKEKVNETNGERKSYERHRRRSEVLIAGCVQYAVSRCVVAGDNPRWTRIVFDSFLKSISWRKRICSVLIPVHILELKLGATYSAVIYTVVTIKYDGFKFVLSMTARSHSRTRRYRSALHHMLRSTAEVKALICNWNQTSGGS
jgi:hypothetical protein